MAFLAGASPALRAFAAALRHNGHAVAEHALADRGATEWLRAPGSAATLIDAACLGDGDAPVAASVFVADAVQAEALPPAWLHGVRRLIAASDDTAQRLGARGAPAACLRTVLPGTDPAPRSAGPLMPQCCVVSAAPPGDAQTLLRALHRLPDLDWTLALAATPPHAIEAAPRLRHATTIEPLWEDAGVFALVAEDDRGAALVAQALRRGVPVAVTASGSVKPLVPANAGVIAAPGDVVALSNGLRRMIFDAPLRAAMAEAAWAHGRTLPDWAMQAAMLVAALEG